MGFQSLTTYINFEFIHLNQTFPLEANRAAQNLFCNPSVDDLLNFFQDILEVYDLHGLECGAN